VLYVPRTRSQERPRCCRSPWWNRKCSRHLWRSSAREQLKKLISKVVSLLSTEYSFLLPRSSLNSFDTFSIAIDADQNSNYRYMTLYTSKVETPWRIRIKEVWRKRFNIKLKKNIY